MSRVIGFVAGFLATAGLALLGFETLAAVDDSPSPVREVFEGRSGLNGGALRLLAGYTTVSFGSLRGAIFLGGIAGSECRHSKKGWFPKMLEVSVVRRRSGTRVRETRLT